MTIYKRTLLREATSDTTDFVALITPADLSLDTPCDGWTVAHLMAHMIGQNSGFATAVRAGDAELADFAPAAPYTRTWHESVALLHAAFDDAADDKPVRLIELNDAPLTVDLALTVQIVDTAVHAWDLAAALGRDYQPNPDIVAAVLATAEQIPDDESRLAEHAAFGPAIPPGADGWDRALALLGRRTVTGNPQR